MSLHRWPRARVAGSATAASCSGTTSGVGLPRGLVAEIRRHALRRPLDVAIEEHIPQQPLSRAWSYRQLWIASELIAARLNHLGLSPGDRVAIALPRGISLVVCELAALRAGIVFVPLSCDQPARRIHQMVAHCEARFLLTDGAMAGHAQPHVIDVTPWFESLESPPVAREPWRDAPHASDPQAVAYGIFTSGSTGFPKATMLRHGGLANLVAAQREFLRIGPGTRVLQFAAPGFDASISEIFVTLAAGGTLCIPSSTELMPGERLARCLREYRIEWATLTPSILAMLPEVKLPLLKTLVVAGEACSAELASRWSRGRRLVNAYGPSECTVCATMFECPEGAQAEPPLGSPIAGTKLKVVGEDRRMAAIGERGELWIGGASVGLGYLNDPAATAEHFVNDTDGDAWFRTGDIVEVDAGGSLRFRGRVDEQIKLRGVRVEPGEIRHVLESVEGVRQAVVQIADAQTPDARLVAYLLTDGAARSDLAARCGRACADRLPVAMIPSRYFAVRQWPRTNSGKIDRERLAQSAEELPQLTPPVDDETAPVDALEHAVLAAFRQSLQAPRLRGTDSFFAAGGDSLVAAHLAASIEDATGCSCSIATLAAHATPTEVAAHMRHTESPERRRLVPLRRDPLSARQGEGEPLFLVHPGGGNALCYMALARALPGDRSCWGLQAQGVDGKEPPIESIDEMARHYIESIRTVQPRGPYHLAGWSFGGFVAFEMARQIRQQGEAVGWLGLIDAGLGYCTHILKEVSGSNTLAEGLLQGTDDVDGPTVRLARQLGVFPEGLCGSRLRGYIDVLLANVRALSRWQPRNYDGPLDVLFAPNSAIDRRRWPDREWSRWSHRVAVRPIPGGHLTLMREPDVSRLAEAIAAGLEQATACSR